MAGETEETFARKFFQRHAAGARQRMRFGHREDQRVVLDEARFQRLRQAGRLQHQPEVDPSGFDVFDDLVGRAFPKRDLDAFVVFRELP